MLHELSFPMHPFMGRSISSKKTLGVIGGMYF
jgi:hypothetical protein